MAVEISEKSWSSEIYAAPFPATLSALGLSAPSAPGLALLSQNQDEICNEFVLCNIIAQQSLDGPQFSENRASPTVCRSSAHPGRYLHVIYLQREAVK